MTKPANSSKPSPADTPTKRPNDKGGKSKVKKEDKQYTEKDADFGDVASEHEEQPKGRNNI